LEHAFGAFGFLGTTHSVINEWKGVSAATSDDKGRKRGDVLLYHVQCVELVAAVCRGRFTPGARLVLDNGYAPSYCHLLTILKTEMPYALRSAYTKLLTALYVDIEPFAEMDPVSLTRIWEPIGPLNADLLESSDYYHIWTYVL